MKTSLPAATLSRCLSDDGSGQDGGTCVVEEEKRADMEYDHALAQSLASGAAFEDPDFGAVLSSLGSGKGSVTMRVRDASTGTVTTREVPIEWLRPSAMGRLDLGQQPWVLSRMAPSGADVAQGSEGDCWLLSAMSVAAEGEGHVAHALRSAEADGCGAVQIRLCLGGLWTVVTVDDRVPCDALSRAPVFARGAHSQLWPCMIEKAIAKVTGSFRALSGGTVAEGLRLMTGASVTRLHLATNETTEEREMRKAASYHYDAVRRMAERSRGRPNDTASMGSEMHRVVARARAAGLPIGKDAEEVTKAAGGAECDVDMLWARMQSWKESGCLMGASCGVDGVEWEDQRARAREAAAAVGLQTEHAYSVLELVSSGSDRLLRLRNPWGRGEYKGKYGSSWDGWTDELRHRLGAYGMEGSGVFFIELRDFLRYFGSVEVARLHRRWKTMRSATLLAESPRGLSVEGGFPAWELVSDEDADGYLTLWQASGRLRGGGRLRGLAPGEDLRTMMAEGVVGADGRPAEAAAASSASSSRAAASAGPGGGRGPPLAASSSSGVVGEDGRLLARDRRKPAPELSEIGFAVHGAGAAAASSSSASSSSDTVGPFVGGGLRTFGECANADIRFSAGRRYTVVPLAFAHMARGQWQEAVLSIHAPSSMRLRRITLSARRFSEALLERISSLGTCQRLEVAPGEVVMVRQLYSDQCSMVAVENRTKSHAFSFELTLSDVRGAVASRGGTFTRDVLPPRCFQIVQVLSLDSTTGYSFSTLLGYSAERLESATAALTAESHFPVVSGMHQCVMLD